MPGLEPTGKQPGEFKPVAVPELTIGTPPEQAPPASPETPVAPPVPAPEAGPTSAVTTTPAEAPVSIQPAKEVTFEPSEQAATMADQHASLVPESPKVAPPAQSEAAAVSNSSLAEKLKGVLGRVIDKVSAKPKPSAPESQIVIPGAREDAPVIPIAESNPGRRAELDRLAKIAEKTGKPGVISREDQDALDRGILTANNQQDPQDQESVQREAA